jgi:hypothetical protein
MFSVLVFGNAGGGLFGYTKLVGESDNRREVHQ